MRIQSGLDFERLYCRVVSARLQGSEGHNVGVSEVGPVPLGALRRHVVVVQTTARRVAQLPPLASRHGLSEMHKDINTNDDALSTLI